MIRHIRILFFLMATSLAVSVSSASLSLKVSLDSAYMLMGRTTSLHIELIKDASADGRLLIPRDSICGNVEILKLLDADTSDIGSGRIEIKQDIVLQSFDSGVYHLNPVLYVDGKDTLRSNRLVLKVFPVDVDTLRTIHDYADVSDIDRHFIDYLPDFVVDYGLWIIAVIIILAVGAYIVYMMRHKKNPFSPAAPKPVPPYERAIGELNKLRSEKLCENGQEKEYYTRLTDILRIYLHGRFGVNAMEMTSTQIRSALMSNEETRVSKTYMDRVLETADFVKFAKVRPLPDDNVRAFSSALQFVEDTKPQPVVEDDGTESTKATEDKQKQ